MNAITPSVRSEQKLFLHITYSLILTFAVLFCYIHGSENFFQKIQQLSCSLLIWPPLVFILFLFINKEKRTFKQTVHFSLVTGILIGVLFFNIAQR